MRNLSSTFRRNMFYGKRNYDYHAVITLASGTVLTLDNTKLWSGGFNWDDAVSDDGSFTALGSTIIGSATVIIDNMNDSYSDYNFTNAKVVLSLSMDYEYDNATITETIKIGKYTVDTAEYNGALITLNLLDNMEQFDRPYNANAIVWPARLDSIIIDACQKCGVTLGTYNFPHKEYNVEKLTSTDGVTYRNVVSWIATIAGCFARCNADGYLELKWFDTDTLESLEEGFDGGVFDSSRPYSSGDNVEGGSFNPWNTGTDADGGEFSVIKNVNYIGNLYSQNIGVDDIVITGIGISVEEEDADGKKSDVLHLFGTDDYMIQISGNKFINVTNYTEIGTWLRNQIVGIRFRNATVSHLNDPAIEAGDLGIIIDRKENQYVILITRTNFNAGSTQTTVCGAESASRNSATRFSEATRAYVDARKLLNEEQTAREQAVKELNDALAAKSGLYSTQETATGGGTIYYLHDKPDLDDSKVVWKMTSEAIGVTTNYDGDDTVWNFGVTVNGTVIANILNSIGVNADWIRTGALEIKTQINGNDVTIFKADATNKQIYIQAYAGNTETFFLDSSTGVVRINASEFRLSGTTFDSAVDTRIEDALDDLDISGEISSELTKENLYPILFGDSGQGIVLYNGNLYIDWEHAWGGTLTLGGYNNTHGTLAIKNASNNDIITASYFGIRLWNGTQRTGEFDNTGITLHSYGTGTPGRIFGYEGTSTYRSTIHLAEAPSGGGAWTSSHSMPGKVAPQTIQAYGISTYTNKANIMCGDTVVLAYYPYQDFKYGTTDYPEERLIADTNGVHIMEEPLYLHRCYMTYSTTAKPLALNDDDTVVYTSSSSSLRYKHVYGTVKKQDIEEAYNIKVYMARYKDGHLVSTDPRNGKTYPMFIAEQMLNHLPIAVDLNDNGKAETWNERVIIPIMFQMIKSQKETIDEQEEKIEELQQTVQKNIEQMTLQQEKIQNLEERLAALEALLN